ncbi:MFS transporter [Sphingomonas sp. PAMC26645]|uniref:MFS transporter n=1 Tax=Sphingomonas sp. PAMC26645 TaxID=2565555 RepID=UPI00109DCDA8|nr:MFS transporter [Sphingomonas sp. PAMC26645]QCB43295.1 MFS transporter [Sphingomonas sp. PAMC26645]
MATVASSRRACAGALRLGLVYAALYAGNGIASPYMPSWFRAVGLSGEQIGLLLAAPMLARIVTGPALGLWADGFALRRTAVVLLLLSALAAYSSMALLDGFAALAVAWFVAATAVSACSPLIDVIVLRRATSEGFAYATPRGLGSAAYVAGNIAAGLALAEYGPPVALLGTAAMVALAVVAAHFLLPRDLTVENGPSVATRARSAGAADQRRPRFRSASGPCDAWIRHALRGHRSSWIFGHGRVVVRRSGGRARFAETIDRCRISLERTLALRPDGMTLRLRLSEPPARRRRTTDRSFNVAATSFTSVVSSMLILCGRLLHCPCYVYHEAFRNAAGSYTGMDVRVADRRYCSCEHSLSVGACSLNMQSRGGTAPCCKTLERI